MKMNKKHAKGLIILICMMLLSALFLSCSGTHEQQEKESINDALNQPQQSTTTPDQAEPTEQPEVPSYPVQFEDAAFEKAIRKLIGKPQGEILNTDLLGITEIDIWGEQVNDEFRFLLLRLGHDNNSGQIHTLNDLKLFPSLKSLSICLQKDMDIGALSGLTNLEDLQLYNNQITDISMLKDLKNLKRLNLSGNKISDISALKDLTNLKTLVLQGNQISDISPL